MWRDRAEQRQDTEQFATFISPVRNDTQSVVVDGMPQYTTAVQEHRKIQIYTHIKHSDQDKVRRCIMHD
jgi:hypothetical protein